MLSCLPSTQMRQSISHLLNTFRLRLVSHFCHRSRPQKLLKRTNNPRRVKLNLLNNSKLIRHRLIKKMAVMIGQKTQIYCRFHKELIRSRNKSPRVMPMRMLKHLTARMTILPPLPQMTCLHFHKLSRKEKKCQKLHSLWMTV